MIWLLIITVLSMIVCYSIARRRGANTTLWVVLGFVLGPFAIPFAFFAKSKPPANLK